HESDARSPRLPQDPGRILPRQGEADPVSRSRWPRGGERRRPRVGPAAPRTPPRDLRGAWWGGDRAPRDARRPGRAFRAGDAHGRRGGAPAAARPLQRRERARRGGARLADIAIATSDNPRTEDPEKILDAVEAGMGAKPHHREVDRRRAIALGLELARAGDTLLLAGKGHETYQVIGTEKVAFDERAVVKELGA